MMYPVITSRPAQEDYLRIQNRHSQITQDLSAQAAKLREYEMNQKAELQQQNADMLDRQQKAAELSVKAASLGN